MEDRLMMNQNPTLYQLMNSDMGAQVSIVVTADQLKQLVCDIVRNTAQFVDEKYAPEFYTVKQAAKMLCISVGTIYNLIHEGRISYSIHEGKYCFSRQDLRDYDSQKRKGQLEF